MSRLNRVISNACSPNYLGVPTASGKLTYLTGVSFPDVHRDSVEAYRLWEDKIEVPLRTKIHMDAYPWEKLNV